MNQLTLQQLFGVNVVETSQALLIKKSDLTLLTPSSNNTAESLLIAVLLKALENFEGILTDPIGNEVTDPQDRVITYNNSNLYLFNVSRWNSYLKKRDNLLFVTDTMLVSEFTDVNQ